MSIFIITVIIIVAVVVVVVVIVANVVVELPQTPEDDHQKRYSCAWKADELITVIA